jgi:hypothetical protein
MHRCFSNAGDDSRFLLQLARNVVAVPYGKVLYIKVDLQFETCNNKEVKHMEANLKFANGVPSQRHKDNGGNEVEANITWYPEVKIGGIGGTQEVIAAAETSRIERVNIENIIGHQQPEPSREPEVSIDEPEYNDQH